MLRTGDVVVIDNLGGHKGKAVRKAIREARADIIFLPPYGPDLNPIEQVFVFNRIFAELAAKGPKPERLMIDATHLKAHRAAASLLKGAVP